MLTETPKIAVDQTSAKGAERRTTTRYPTNDAARMQVLQPLAAKAVDIRILDVSQGGLKISMPASVRPGSIIRIDMKRVVVLAEVRYCVRAEADFHAGVLLQDVSWTKESSQD